MCSPAGHSLVHLMHLSKLPGCSAGLPLQLLLHAATQSSSKPMLSCALAMLNIS